MKLLLTCEHGGNIIPPEFQNLFLGQEAILKSHRGYDPGALDLFNSLSELADYKAFHMTSRLLIEVNRSLHHPQLFSEITNQIPSEEKKNLIKDYYQPYRNNIESKIAGMLSKGAEVLHISVHSFTPVLNGKIRNADIGILYDPSRDPEKNYSKILKRKIVKQDIPFRVRFNYPYLGTADGFTTYLRKKFPVKYAGLEIEVNQKFSTNNKMDDRIKTALYHALEYLKKNGLH